MLVVGEDPQKAINDFSNEFLRTFLQQLKTAHGEKAVNINHFYQEFIADRFHTHMTATRWPSLTEFAKYLGREGICRVEETDKGLTVAWIDNSPEALRRQEALRRKELQDKGDEELEQRVIAEQIRRANEARAGGDEEDEEDLESRELKRQEGEKIKLSFGPAKSAAPPAEPKAHAAKGLEDTTADGEGKPSAAEASTAPAEALPAAVAEEKPKLGGGLSLKMTAKPQTKNVFAQAKKNALAGSSKKGVVEQPKKMSQAERIMKEELERKRNRDTAGFGGPAHKKQRTDFRR